jgi:AcrR family transcriptional regulator
MAAGEDTGRLRPAPRRAPSTADRGRRAERTREKILDAAVAEFGAKGYSGARTAGIAARAGVNEQLIAYYFDGKQGVLDELRRRWSARQDKLVPPEATFGESLQAYLDGTLDRPDWARLVVWRALGDDPGHADNEDDAAQRRRLQRGVERIRARQRDGELTGTVSAGFVMLLAHMITFAPVAMPQIVQDILGIDPYSPEYRRLCSQQLAALLASQSHSAPSAEHKLMAGGQEVPHQDRVTPLTGQPAGNSSDREALLTICRTF